jgi:SAM-dependent methyltransferase
LDLLTDTYNYNHWIYSMLRPFLGSHICEVGAGIGNLTRFFLSAKQLACIEPESEFCAALNELASRHLNMRVFQKQLEDPTLRMSDILSADSVVCVNVLEHIQDHGEALRMMAAMAKPDGSILLYVPACPWAFGALDRALGHYRRYSKKGLEELAQNCGLHVLMSRYVNFIGVFGWWWYSRVLAKTEISNENARFVDRYVPYISAVERIFPPMVGQSLFAVLKKN